MQHKQGHTPMPEQCNNMLIVISIIFCRFLNGLNYWKEEEGDGGKGRFRYRFGHILTLRRKVEFSIYRISRDFQRLIIVTNAKCIQYELNMLLESVHIVAFQLVMPILYQNKILCVCKKNFDVEYLAYDKLGKDEVNCLAGLEIKRLIRHLKEGISESKG